MIRMTKSLKLKKAGFKNIAGRDLPIVIPPAHVAAKFAYEEGTLALLLEIGSDVSLLP